MQLAQLSPGVLFETGRLTKQNVKGGFSANGNRVFMNAYQLDGLDNTSYAESYRGLNMEALQPSVDAESGTAMLSTVPTSFDETSVAIVDAAGKTTSAPLVFVSPGQITFQVPATAAVGTAKVTVTSTGSTTQTASNVVIGPVALALFTANGNALLLG